MTKYAWKCFNSENSFEWVNEIKIIIELKKSHKVYVWNGTIANTHLPMIYYLGKVALVV